MNPTEAPPRTPPQGASLFLGYWLPVIVYVALIFTASSIPGRDIPTLFTNSDKLEHLAEYALFGLLLGRAFRFTIGGGRGKFWSLATVLLASCAKPPGAPQPPESGEYLFPSWPAGELRPDQERRIDKAWRSLLAGDATAAERELQKALQRDPGLVPAATALAYARLAQGRIAEAAGGFEDVLRRRTDYVPAVAGAAQAAQRAGDTEAALRLYQRAQSLAPDNPLLRRRLAEVRLQVTEKRVADARWPSTAPRWRPRPRWPACVWSSPLFSRTEGTRPAPSRSSKPIPRRTARCCCTWASCSRA